jgi:plasmid stabilization system protein ParE
MRVRFTPRARDDLAAILQYLDERSPQGALNVKRTLRTTIDLIGQYPQSGRLSEMTETHVLPAGRYPAPLRARANAARALGEPRDSALRPLRAVREELAGRRNAKSVLRSQARPGVGGNGQGAARRNAAMRRREASALR